MYEGAVRTCSFSIIIEFVIVRGGEMYVRECPFR
jgi:hypothetical protein